MTLYTTDFRNIRAEMTRDKLTYADLANTLGVSKRTISNWLNNTSEIPATALIRMSKMFDCSTDYLLGIDKTN